MANSQKDIPESEKRSGEVYEEENTTHGPSSEKNMHNELAYKGDESDGKVSWTPRTLIAALSLGGLYTGSQIMLYFAGGTLSFIQTELGLVTNASWLPVSNTLAITAVAPFVGYLQDLVGRRNITLVGCILLMVGIALMGSTHSFGQAVVGMALGGAGAGICELSFLAGLSDIVPVKYRGISLALAISTIFPFAPYVMYSQLLGTYSTWRWGQWISLIWNGLVFSGLLLTYFPKSHPRLAEYSRARVLASIDYVGAVLSIVGITILCALLLLTAIFIRKILIKSSLVVLQAGGYSHPWRSAYVLVQLILGIFLIIAFVVWEWKFAQNPMVPRDLFHGQRVVALAYFISFVAGMDFYSILNFFPLTFSAMYKPDPVQVGLKGLGYGLGTTAGAVVFNALLSVKNFEARYTLLIGCVLMTTFGAALAATTPDTPGMTVAFGTLAGIGIGGVIVPATTVSLIVVPDPLLATAAALALSIRTVGGSIGYTIYAAIFNNKLRNNLPRIVAAYVSKAGLPSTYLNEFVTIFLTAPTKLATAPGYTPAIAEAATIGSRWAYAESLKYVWYVTIPFGVLAAISCLFLPSIRNYQTNRIAVQI